MDEVNNVLTLTAQTSRNTTNFFSSDHHTRLQRQQQGRHQPTLVVGVTIGLPRTRYYNRYLERRSYLIYFYVFSQCLLLRRTWHVVRTLYVNWHASGILLQYQTLSQITPRATPWCVYGGSSRAGPLLRSALRCAPIPYENSVIPFFPSFPRGYLYGKSVQLCQIRD